jgi:hypothetical protein
MLTHPFNFGAKALPQDDQLVYDEIADVFKWTKFGPAIKTVGYTAPGESDDWMYAMHHIISMSPEVGPENGDFWPPAPLVSGIDTRNYKRTAYVVKKAGLELQAAWRHKPAKTAGVPPKVNKKLAEAGGEAVSVLSLELKNRGLSSSAGEVLHVAVSGTTRNNADYFPDGVVVLQGDGDDAPQKPAQLFFTKLTGDGSDPTLGFQIAPLARRSSIKLRIYLAATVDSVEERDTLKLCAVEIPKADVLLPPAVPAVCQCITSGKLPPATSLQEGATQPSSGATLVKFRGPKAVTAMEKLCNAAVNTASAAGVKTVQTTRQPQSCCQAVTAECLACSLGISVVAYCASTPAAPGCSKAKEFGCCFSFTFADYKPCCLFTEINKRKEKCKKGDGHLSGWNPTCPVSAAEAAKLLNVQAPATPAATTAAPQASWVTGTTGPILTTSSQSAQSDGGWTLSMIVLVVCVMATCLLAQVVLRRRGNRQRTPSGDDVEAVPAMKIPTSFDGGANGPID